MAVLKTLRGFEGCTLRSRTEQQPQCEPVLRDPDTHGAPPHTDPGRAGEERDSALYSMVQLGVVVLVSFGAGVHFQKDSCAG